MDYIFIAAIYLLNIPVLYHIITSCDTLVAQRIFMAILYYII